MRVYNIQNYSNDRNYTQNTISPNNTKYNKINSDIFAQNNQISFCAKYGSQYDCSFNSATCYTDFIRNCNQKHNNKPIPTIVDNAIKNQPLFGFGKEKKIYVFPKMENYLIAHLYTKSPRDTVLPIMECPIRFPKYNFGQPIAHNGYDILITKYIPGVPNSVTNSTDAAEYICKYDSATPVMAKEYLSKLKLFKDYTQSSYDDLAKQIKYLSDNGMFIDIANPNNLLIDIVHRKFHLIDLLPEHHLNVIKKLSDESGGIKPGTYDMMNLLLDPRLQPYYLDKMSNNEIQETIQISEKVIKRTLLAGRKYGLGTTNELIRQTFEYVQNVFPLLNKNFTRRYEEFFKLYHL